MSGIKDVENTGEPAYKIVIADESGDTVSILNQSDSTKLIKILQKVSKTPQIRINDNVGIVGVTYTPSEHLGMSRLSLMHRYF